MLPTLKYTHQRVTTIKKACTFSHTVTSYTPTPKINNKINPPVKILSNGCSTKSKAVMQVRYAGTLGVKSGIFFNKMADSPFVFLLVPAPAKASGLEHCSAIKYNKIQIIFTADMTT